MKFHCKQSVSITHPPGESVDIPPSVQRFYPCNSMPEHYGTKPQFHPIHELHAPKIQTVCDKTLS